MACVSLPRTGPCRCTLGFFSQNCRKSPPLSLRAPHLCLSSLQDASNGSRYPSSQATALVLQPRRKSLARRHLFALTTSPARSEGSLMGAPLTRMKYSLAWGKPPWYGPRVQTLFPSGEALRATLPSMTATRGDSFVPAPVRPVSLSPLCPQISPRQKSCGRFRCFPCDPTDPIPSSHQGKTGLGLIWPSSLTASCPLYDLPSPFRARTTMFFGPIRGTV